MKKYFTLYKNSFFICLLSSLIIPIPTHSLDVPYVPTPRNVVEQMLKMAKVGPDDLVVDLGSGDGRIVLTAVESYGARGRGIELDAGRVEMSRAAAKASGISDRAEFLQEDIFKTKISDATVVTMYLLADVNLRIRPRLLSELRPGVRIVSHSFDMGTWRPDKHHVMDTGQNIYFWVVPAQMEGSWPVKDPSNNEQEMIVRINKQSFQDIEGTIQINNETLPIKGSVKGNKIRFSLEQRGEDHTKKYFRGRIKDSQLVGRLVDK